MKIIQKASIPRFDTFSAFSGLYNWVKKSNKVEQTVTVYYGIFLYT